MGKARHGVIGLKLFQSVVKICVHLFNNMHLPLKPILLTLCVEFHEFPCRIP